MTGNPKSKLENLKSEGSTQRASASGSGHQMTPFWILDFGFSISRSKCKKIFCLPLCALLLALHVSADAQQPKKVPRIGFLIASLPSATSARIEAFRQGLRELGYVEGKNIVIEYHYAEGKLD